MWEMDYDTAASAWEEKDKVAVHMEPVLLRKRIDSFITENNTCALATSAGDAVRCTPIEYNYTDGSFWLFSEGGAKFRGLKVNKNVCLAIFTPYHGFGSLKGLQIQGKASLTEPFSADYVKIMEFKKIPMAAMKSLPNPMNLIRIDPVSFDYLDSDLKKEGFGTRQHLDV